MTDKYQNGKIYAIRNYIDNDVYVGSTTYPLSKRMSEHRIQMKNHPDRILYRKMNELGSEQFYIELVEQFPCDNSEQLHKKEGKYIKKFGTLNSQIAGRNNKEYQKQYRKDNLEQLRAKQNERHDCPCGGKFTRSNKAYHFKSKKHQEYISSQSTTANNTDSGSDSD